MHLHGEVEDGSASHHYVCQGILEGWNNFEIFEEVLLRALLLCVCAVQCAVHKVILPRARVQCKCSHSGGGCVVYGSYIASSLNEFLNS